MKLAELGQEIAELEKWDYVPENKMNYDSEFYKGQVPQGFKLSWSKSIQPFDEDQETVTLTDGNTDITIPCPLDVQRINIAGYDIVKNVWMKFNSYGFTNCPFVADDMQGFLDLINKLHEYVELVGEIDNIMHDIIGGRFSLILPY